MNIPYVRCCIENCHGAAYTVASIDGSCLTQAATLPRSTSKSGYYRKVGNGSCESELSPLSIVVISYTRSALTETKQRSSPHTLIDVVSALSPRAITKAATHTTATAQTLALRRSRRHEQLKDATVSIIHSDVPTSTMQLVSLTEMSTGSSQGEARSSGW